VGAFSSTAFDTDAFSASAFDFGAAVEAEPATTTALLDGPARIRRQRRPASSVVRLEFGTRAIVRTPRRLVIDVAVAKLRFGTYAKAELGVAPAQPPVPEWEPPPVRPIKLPPLPRRLAAQSVVRLGLGTAAHMAWVQASAEYEAVLGIGTRAFAKLLPLPVVIEEPVKTTDDDADIALIAALYYIYDNA
jgi:hypothetical protein